MKCTKSRKIKWRQKNSKFNIKKCHLSGPDAIFSIDLCTVRLMISTTDARFSLDRKKLEHLGLFRLSEISPIRLYFSTTVSLRTGSSASNFSFLVSSQKTRRPSRRRSRARRCSGP